MDPLPMVPDALIGASCSLAADEIRERLAEWRGLRERAARIEPLADGLRLHLDPGEPLDEVARLVALEAECCAFYRFSLELQGASRQLTIDAGKGGGAAVAALLGLP